MTNSTKIIKTKKNIFFKAKQKCLKTTKTSKNGKSSKL